MKIKQKQQYKQHLWSKMFSIELCYIGHHKSYALYVIRLEFHCFESNVEQITKQFQKKVTEAPTFLRYDSECHSI